MKITLEILLILVLSVICFQDFKERKVALLLLVLGALLGGAIHFWQQSLSAFISSIFMNFVFIGVVILFIAFYSKVKMKKALFEVFGGGDLVFFVLLAVSFPTLSFVVFFIFSLVFSLAIYLLIKHQMKEETVPLAGLQSAFLMLLILTNICTNMIDLYRF